MADRLKHKKAISMNCAPYLYILPLLYRFGRWQTVSRTNAVGRECSRRRSLSIWRGSGFRIKGLGLRV
jgi:hypothetical protein